MSRGLLTFPALELLWFATHLVFNLVARGASLHASVYNRSIAPHSSHVSAANIKTLELIMRYVSWYVPWDVFLLVTILHFLPFLVSGLLACLDFTTSL